jgi:hypothetical protein
MENNLAAPCGIFCGACRQYLLLKKDLLEKRGYKIGCKGCRIRNKNCAFIRRDCQVLRKKEIEFCFECDKFPCQNLKNLDKNYQENYYLSPIVNLKRIKIIGTDKWLQEQEKLYTCLKCDGEICVHDSECFDCGNKLNPNKK